jgi:hypothetical protein
VSHGSSMQREKIALASDNGQIYLFDGESDINITNSDAGNQLLGDHSSLSVKGLCRFLCSAELPVKVRCNSNMNLSL